MEPTRKKVEFVLLEDAFVVLRHPQESKVIAPLWELAGELFAEHQGFVQLYKDGFTSGPYQWEHYINLPFHIRANALGRIVICQS